MNKTTKEVLQKPKIVRYHMNALHWSRQAISVSFDWESMTAIEKAEN